MLQAFYNYSVDIPDILMNLSKCLGPELANVLFTASKENLSLLESTYSAIVFLSVSHMIKRLHVHERVID